MKVGAMPIQFKSALEIFSDNHEKRKCSPSSSLVNVVIKIWVGFADTVRQDIFIGRCESDSRYSIDESTTQVGSKPFYLQRD
jgi:hypothetical protein